MDNFRTDLNFKVVDEGWATARLGDVVSFSKGKGISKDDIVFDGKTECIRYGELYTTYGEVIKEVVSKTNIDKDELVFSEVNDIVIPSSGETQIDIARASCVLKSGVALGGDLNILKTKLDAVYLSYYLNSAKKQEIARMAQGISVVHLYASQLQNLIINYPLSIIHSTKIASCLSSLDEVIAAHSQKLELLKDHKKGLMQNLFPQEGEKVPKYRFKEFEKDGEWVEKIFDDILDITRLAGYEYSEYWKEDAKKEIIALRGYNIGKGTLLLHNLGYISNELSLQLNRSKLYKGDIVYPCVGTIGNAVVIEEDNKFHIQQNIAKLTPKKDVSPYFISHFLMSHLGLIEVNKFNATSSQPNVLVGSLRNFKIFIPKIAEQQKIASCLYSLDALITAQAEKIEQLKLHKKGLMQGLFPKIKD
jgi:type I restriction enzyme S subunit